MKRISGIVERKGRVTPPRRRTARQKARRQAERIARRSAVGLARWVGARGLPRRAAAAQLGVSLSTLSRWVRQWREDCMALTPRGRPLVGADPTTRAAVRACIARMGPHVGLPVLRAQFPAV